MKTMKRSDFGEDIIYVCECPNCAEMIETNEDPQYEEMVFCDHCNESFDLED